MKTNTVPANLDNPTVPGNAPLHTPGPWRSIPDDGTGTLPAVLASQVTSYGNFFVAQCNVEADAILCAAAPDLLAALEALYGQWLGEYTSELNEQALAAINKAKGTL